MFYRKDFFCLIFVLKSKIFTKPFLNKYELIHVFFFNLYKQINK